MINEFLQNVDVKDEKELNEKLQEFMTKYNNGEISYENTLLDDAYELLEKASNTKSKTHALKYAKEAYEMCPECFDALLFQVDMIENSLKRMQLLDEGLEKEKKRLENEGYFDKDAIGHFYEIFETRPYIKGLYSKAEYLILDGKMKQACEVCKEIIRLNSNDNMGARYTLMALYAFFEDEKELLKLNKKYPQDTLEMLFPLFAYYYKAGDDQRALEYLKQISDANSHFVKYFRGTIKENPNTPYGYYSPGDASEVLMYFDNYVFLTNTMLTLKDYVLENCK